MKLCKQERVERKVDYLLSKAEDEVWKKAEKTMLRLYYNVGRVLGELDLDEFEREVWFKELSIRFDLEPKFFAVAYDYAARETKR